MKPAALATILMVATFCLSAPLAWPQANPDGDFITLQNERFRGDLYTNGPLNNGQLYADSKNGFRTFYYYQNPEVNLFIGTGLYFEHIYNGTLKDDWRAMYAPERVPCHVRQLNSNSGQISWYGPECLWNIDCAETFTFTGESVDFKFTATINEENTAPLGYLAFMWASYINSMAIERNIHFYGVDKDANAIKWVSVGDIGPNRYIAAEKLPFVEQGANGMNVGETGFRFVRPFYYGFVDADGDLSTIDDTLLLVMMFDRAQDIRLTMFDPRSDTHGPAWDYQFVVHEPKVGRTYGYCARLMLVPVSQILADQPDRASLTESPPDALNDWAIGQWKEWVASLPETPPNSPPAILFVDKNLDTGEYMQWPKDRPFIPPAIVAGDDSDGDISSAVTFDVSKVNVNRAGQYELTSQVEDSGGLRGQRHITIDIVDDQPSVFARFRSCLLRVMLVLVIVIVFERCLVTVL